ncbi:MAG: transcriptional repressor LexA [Chitinispirillaceae bacterium]|nr:transcriptional repressor LexA [Chitinispirillaceae bacterium]
MKESLTEEQKRVLSFIVSYKKEKGFPPTVREIAAALQYHSVNNARQHLRLIEKKGAIRILKGKARGIEINSFFKEETEENGIPIVGRVAAGLPITAIENIEGYLQLDKTIFTGDNLFALKIKGDSMRDIGILDGDIAIVKRCEIAENGEIVVAIIEGEATLKRFFRREGAIILKSENSGYKEIVVNSSKSLQIAGKLVGIIRKY